LTKKTNIAPEGKETFWKGLYNNFNVGILSMITGVVCPFVIPILGQFFAPLFFVGGIVAVLKSAQPIWVRAAVLLLFIVPLVIWWDLYVYHVFSFTQYVNEPG
jgi:hypothetical protein